MSTCNYNDIYESLEHCIGEVKLPGVQRILYLSKQQIVNLPSLPDLGKDGLTMGEAGTISENITTAADKVFLDIKIGPTGSDLSSESQGTWPNMSFLDTLTIAYPGNNAEAVGFCRQANNDDIVYLAQMRTGKWRLVGNNICNTETKPSQATGSAVTDEAGTTIVATVSGVSPAPFFEGTVPTADGVLNCKTNELAEA